MRPCLHRDATPRQATEYLLHGFRCGRQLVLQNNFSCFIQNAVRTGAVSQIQSNGRLPLENVFPLVRIVLIFCIAGLLFIVLRARRTLGAYRIPQETGLHPIWNGYLRATSSPGWLSLNARKPFESLSDNSDAKSTIRFSRGRNLKRRARKDAFLENLWHNKPREASLRISDRKKERVNLSAPGF